MATIRDFSNPFALTDLSSELSLIPNKWGLINDLGLFEDQGITQHTTAIEYTNGSLGLITDQVRGAKNLVNKDEVRKIVTYAVPHFPQDDYLSPQDIIGIRAYGTQDQAENEAAVMARKLERIRMNHAITIEAARAHAITNLAVYAPNATVSGTSTGSYATDFGVTRTSVDFVLGTSTTNIMDKIESVISTVQDNVQNGGVINDIIVLCSPEWFAKLINHAKAVSAFTYYSSVQEPLRNRLGTGLYRRFEFGGLTFVEYRGSYNGTRLIPAGKAYALPRGVTGMYQSIYSPANKFSLANTIGEPSGYVFTYRSPEDEKIVIQSEHNALHLITRPAATVELTSSN